MTTPKLPPGTGYFELPATDKKQTEVLLRAAVMAWLTTSSFWLAVGFSIGFIVGVNW